MLVQEVIFIKLIRQNRDIRFMKSLRFRKSDVIKPLKIQSDKVELDAQDSTEVLQHFRFANAMSNQISELIKDGGFKFQGKNIINLNEIELIY